MPNRRIEEMIHDVLKGESQKNALDFVAHLRANEIPLGDADGYWDVSLDGKSVCFILINGEQEAPGPWTIWSDQEPGTWVRWSDGGAADDRPEATASEHTKQSAWASVNFCASCGGNCSPGKSKTIFGKPFDHLCNSALAFTDPDADALDCAKQMVDARKKDILGGI